jgi:hypothetical protein
MGSRLTPMRDDDVCAALQRHWAASDATDFAAEHAIYADHAVLEYPQSGERIRGGRSPMVFHGRQYFDKPFEPGPFRAEWVEPMD